MNPNPELRRKLDNAFNNDTFYKMEKMLEMLFGQESFDEIYAYR